MVTELGKLVTKNEQVINKFETDMEYYANCTDTSSPLLIAMHAVAKALYTLWIRYRAHAGPSETEPDVNG